MGEKPIEDRQCFLNGILLGILIEVLDYTEGFGGIPFYQGIEELKGIEVFANTNISLHGFTRYWLTCRQSQEEFIEFTIEAGEIGSYRLGYHLG